MAPDKVEREAKELATKVASMASDITGINFLRPHSEWRIMLAGASAGLVVDSTLYPLDTIKSRLQSKEGFSKAGGFGHLYRGIKPVLVGSIPNAAIFFITYETIKDKLHHYKIFSPRGKGHVLNHMIAAGMGEVVSCAVRVPYEVVKTRSQTSQAVKFSSMAIAREVIAKEGMIGLYRGFSSTIVRDLPFSAIQYPIWERLKLRHLKRHKRPVSVSESAYYGSIAGGIAAFLTNPLDVAKTRIMLAERNESLASGRVLWALSAVRAERGFKGLFAGVVPRVLWISAGAAIFLGTYEQAIKLLGTR